MDIFERNYNRLDHEIPAYISGDAEFEMYDCLEEMKKQYELLKNFIKDNMVKKLNAVELPAGKPYKHPLLYEMSQRASKEGKEYFYIDEDSRIPVEVNNPTATYYCQSKNIPDEILKILIEE